MTTEIEKSGADTKAADGVGEATPARPRVLETAVPDRPLPLPALLKLANEQHGKPLGQMVTEIAKLGFGPGKIDVEEYFDLRLFDDKALAGQDKRSFIGMRACKTIGHAANQHSHWFSCVSDKLAFNTLLNGYGLPVAETRGYYHARLRLPALGNLRNADDIHRFLKEQRGYPMFGKPTGSSRSIGVVAIDSYDAATDTLTLGDGRIVPARHLAEDVAQSFDDGFLFQAALQSHPEVRTLSGDRIATVRVYTIYTEKGPRVFRACWKLPVGKNVSDTTRLGNMIAALDMETGTITRAVLGVGLNLVDHETHPTTGARLIGAKVPDWKRLLETALAGAEVFDTIPLLGWDIAPTIAGPVLVEANNTPDFRIVEIAENRGAYDAEMKAFLAETEKYWAESDQIDKGTKRSLKQKSLDRVLSAIRGHG